MAASTLYGVFACPKIWMPALSLPQRGVQKQPKVPLQGRLQETRFLLKCSYHVRATAHPELVAPVLLGEAELPEPKKTRAFMLELCYRTELSMRTLKI